MSDVDNAPVVENNSAPVAPPTGGDAASTPATTTETSADTAVPSETAEPKRDRKVEKRISRLTQQREAAVREAGYWRGVAESSRTPQGEYQADGSQPRQQTRQPDADTGEIEHNKSVLDRIRDAGKDAEDIDDVLEDITSEDIKVSRAMRDFLGESDKPYAMAKWLIDNPREAARIARLESAVAVVALGKVESRLAAKPAPRTTNTPPPPPTVNGRGSPQFNPESASMDDYAKDWERRKAARTR